MEKIYIRDVVEKYWEAIPQVWHTTRSMIRGIASSRYQLTVAQFQVLRRIRNGYTSVCGLADANQISRSAVSKAVDTLVKKGYVVRSHDPKDRRNIPLALSSTGDEVLKDIFGKTENWLESRFSILDETELVSLLIGMSLLRDVFSQTESGAGKIKQ